ncbi:MAG: aerobic carbon-monoxide dehydrogenase large subunit, partial [Caballeronia mineralivorans]|nr:aerobic carbon-monoxide dehydrogenase large subunit [Caballeronia mineralivorans]
MTEVVDHRATRFIGQAITRREDKRLMSGRGKYTSDFRFDGMAYAVFVRSPFAHATIRSIATREAAAAPGVVGVLTARDIEGKVG